MKKKQEHCLEINLIERDGFHSNGKEAEKKQLEQMGSLQLILIASYSRETGQVAQLVNAKRDAPSKLTPFAHVWATSLQTFPIHRIQVSF